jgi:hypothetical protein
MATKNRKPGEQERRWKGGEVEAQAGDTAERAADRVEGNEPVRADAEARRLRERPDVDADEGESRNAAPRADPDDETADAAEEHRDRQATQGYPPRGKL